MREFVRSVRAFQLRLFSALRRQCIRVACSFLIMGGIVGVAHAQGGLAAPPPVFSSVDQYGVDLARGTLDVVTGELSIGAPGAGGLFFARSFIGSGWRHSFVGTINSAPGSSGRMNYTVSMGGASDEFYTVLGNTTFFSTLRSGGSLAYDAGTQRYTYTGADGSVATFDKALVGSGMPWNANEGRIISLREPDGAELTFHYVSATVSGVTGRRLQSVTNNLGYQVHFSYSNNSPANTTELAGPWQNIAQVTAINNAVDYCSPSAATCSSMSQTWPSVSFSLSGAYETITDAAGRATRITYSGGAITAIRRASSSTTDHLTFTYSSGRVATASFGGVTTAYSYADVGAVRTTTVSVQWSLVFPPRTFSTTSSTSTGRLLSTTNGEGETIAYQHDAYERVTRVTQPEGNYTAFVYDTRGNITETRQVAKPGSGLADIVTTAIYPASCSFAVTCNQPESTTDARGFRTDYTYDTAHGGALTITSPAPSGSAPVGSGVRPQTRLAYASYFAYFKNSGGSIVAAPTSVHRLVETSVCATTASCDATPDETLTTLGYGANGVANNRLPVSSTVAAGDPSLNLSADYAYSYDNIGNFVTVDGPLMSADDTTRIRYDVVRQVVGVIGPDPDGAGALKHRAVRTTYNADGQPIAVERGTVDSQSDPDWASFAVLERRETAYNFKGFPERVSFIAQGQTHAEAQMSYDPSNRLTCVAQRMNPATFGAYQACTLTAQGADGPDRLTLYAYDEANRQTQVTQGYRTGFDTNYWTATYTDNGAVETLADANGNLTTYVYDGFDRLYRMRYPNPSSAGSSPTDYDEYAYDAASNVTAWRRRSNDTIDFVYDNLNRAITTDAPGGASLDVSATYDLLGRQLTQATSAQTLTFGYDQLSRLTSAQSAIGTVSYQYDAAARRTRITWPDAFYAQYDYDLTNAVTTIWEQDSGSGPIMLATYAYDNLGRRTSLTRGNGTVTTYGYDAAGRLEELINNLAGTTHDQTLEFGYNAAGQIVSRGNSNAAFDWTPLAPGLTTYADNNLNQYTNVAAAAPGYDARGNLTSNGVRTFEYDVFNRLVSVSGAGSMTLSYDPAGRLYQTIAASTTRFAYNGVALIGEYNGSNVLQRRFVHGPAVDEPIVWYEGSGIGDRRWLVADQLGSVTAVANGSGAVTDIFSYDAYGVPNDWSGMRLRFTGQANLPEAQLYYYRARVYDPSLGRFLQTDPVLFEAGTNFYSYVNNDPVNAIDPTGQWVWFVIGPLTFAAGEYLTQVYESGGDFSLSNKDWGEIGFAGLSGVGVGYGAFGLGVLRHGAYSWISGITRVPGRILPSLSRSTVTFNAAQRGIIGAHGLAAASAFGAIRQYHGGGRAAAGAIGGPLDGLGITYGRGSQIVEYLFDQASRIPRDQPSQNEPISPPNPIPPSVTPPLPWPGSTPLPEVPGTLPPKEKPMVSSRW